MNIRSVREFSWIAIESLFEISGIGTKAAYSIRPDVKEKWPELAQTLNEGKGIYLLAVPSPNSRAGHIKSESIVYIGEAGGIGPKSNFKDRIGKHFLKANGHHKRAGGPSGISISERWLSYVNKAPIQPVTRGMYVRLLQLSGETEEQRHRIGEFENLLMYYWSSLQSDSDFVRTPCNTTSASKKLRESYFEAKIVRLNANDTATEQSPEIEAEPSEDANFDFEEHFTDVISKLEPELRDAGYRVSHRNDGKKTIHFRNHGVEIEMTPLKNQGKVAVRKRRFDLNQQAGAPMPALESQGSFEFQKLSAALRRFLLSSQ